MNSINDSWALDPASHMVNLMLATSEGDQDILEAIINITEVETVEHEDAPSIYLMLADAYSRLTEELDNEFKYDIERRKLKEMGKEQILKMPHDAKTIIEQMGTNPEPIHGVYAANDYMTRINVYQYIEANNAKRAALNFSDAIIKSKRNPEHYAKLVKTIGSRFLLDEKLSPYAFFVTETLKYHWPKEK